MPENRESERPKVNRFKWPKRVVILSIFSGPKTAGDIASVWSRPLFITQELGMKENIGMFLSHFPEAIKLVSGIIAGIIADSYLGKFSVLSTTYISTIILYWPFLILSSIKIFNVSTRIILFIAGLFAGSFASFSNSIYYPFISEQFHLPDDEQALETFYAYDYAYFNLSVAVLGNIFLELASYFKCYGTTPCYTGLFSTGILTLTIFTIVFLSMKKSYVIKLPQSSIIKEAISCICHAIKRKRKLLASGAPVQKMSLLDYASDKYDKNLIEDLKRLNSILIVILISMFYFLLYQQINSKWIYQAALLDGDFANIYTLKPAQVNIINPIVVVILVPFIQHVIYPILRIYHVNFTSLRKIGCGYILTCFTFILAGIIQNQIDSNLKDRSNFYEGQILMINLQRATVYVDLPWFKTQIPEFSTLLVNNLQSGNETNLMVVKNKTDTVWSGPVKVVKGASVTYIVVDSVTRINETLEIKENDKENPVVVLYCCNHCNGTFEFIFANNESIQSKVDIPKPSNSVRIELPKHGVYKARINGKHLKHLISFKRKALYATIILDNKGEPTQQTFIIFDPYQVHVLTIFPQFILLSTAEVLQYSGMSMFLYTQAPTSMRSFVRALYSGSISIAHFVLGLLALIDVSAITWFFSFALLQVVGICLHVMFAKRYIYQASQD